MPEFTSDWFSEKIDPWREHVIPRLRQRSTPAKWLDVGSYEGRSALWALDHVLPPRSTVTCVDLFDSTFRGLDSWGKRGYEDRFDANVANNPGIVKRKGWSSDVLAGLQHERFHGSYVDGDHLEHVLYRDLELLWPLLLPGAVVVCDDYGCDSQPGVRAAVRRFLSRPDVRCRVLHVGFQLIVEKSREPIFSRDFFGLEKQLTWVEHVAPRLQEEPVTWLEIGSYEGQSTHFTLENLLNNDWSSLTCVDPFDKEARELVRWGGNVDYELSFDANVGWSSKVNKIKCKGQVAMASMIESRHPNFNGIYIDSDHAEDVVRTEIQLAWQLLRPGGILVLDDYGSASDPGVRAAADPFVAEKKDEICVLHGDFQLILQKP